MLAVTVTHNIKLTHLTIQEVSIKPQPTVHLPVEYPSGVDSEPGDDPGGGEADEHEVAHLLVVGVLAQLRSLQIILTFPSTNEHLIIEHSQSSKHVIPPRLRLQPLLGPRTKMIF